MNEFSKISKIISQEQLKDLLSRHHFSSWKVFSENAEIFIQMHIFKRPAAEKVVEKIKDLVYSDLEADVLRIYPDFDMTKEFKNFLEEYPSGGEEKRKEPDWEIFREISDREKERRLMIKERILETIFYYAERNEEVRLLAKNI